MAIIDEITDDGLLGTTLEEICETLARNHEGNDSPPELEEVEEILRRIQKFDPTGVGARDLRECLLLQLEQLDGNTPWLKEARTQLQRTYIFWATKISRPWCGRRICQNRS